MEMEILVETEKRFIDFISKIMEGYDGIATVRTIDAQAGIIKILTFEHFVPMVEGILKDISEKNGVVIHSMSAQIWDKTL